MFAVMLAVLAMTGSIGPTDSYVKENAVVCNSKKNLVKYRGHEARGEEDFMRLMREPATCVVKKRAIKAVPLSVTKPMLQVEMVDGYRVWVHEDDFFIPQASVGESLKKGAPHGVDSVY